MMKTLSEKKNLLAIVIPKQPRDHAPDSFNNTASITTITMIKVEVFPLGLLSASFV